MCSAPAMWPFENSQAVRTSSTAVLPASLEDCKRSCRASTLISWKPANLLCQVPWAQDVTQALGQRICHLGQVVYWILMHLSCMSGVLAYPARESRR